MIYFILLISGLTDLPETISLTDQHGSKMILQAQDGTIDWVLFGGDAKTVRLLSRWVGQKQAALLVKGVCIVDITDMPDSIKLKRFLPKIMAIPQQVFILDGLEGFSWLPHRKGVFTLIILKRDGRHQFHFPESLAALDSLLKEA